MYNFFLDDVQLPVAPSRLRLRINNKNDTIVLIDEGEVNILKKPGLTDISFEALLPNVRYPFAVYPTGFRPATYYLAKLEQLKISQQPFQFIVNRLSPDGRLMFDTNMTVSLERYEIIEDAEDTGLDVLVSVELKQYRHYGTKRLNIKTQATGTATATVQKQRPTTGKTTPRTYTVRPGDTLYMIAKRFLGNGSRYPELARLNNIANPNLIYPGQVIKLG